MIGFVSTALTWLKAFKGPCLILAGAAFLGGAGTATWATRAIMRGDVAQAEKHLSDFRAELAAQSVDTERKAADRQRAVTEALRARDQAITASVDGIPAAVARLVAPQFAALRSKINDPAYDCIRTVPLPREYLDGLQRAGGSALDETR